MANNRWLYNGFASMTEFLNGKTGDCGPLALLLLLHLVDGARWELSAAALGGVVSDMQARGLADGNGETNIPHLDAYLTALGIAHTTVGYNDFTTAKLKWRLDNLTDATLRAPLLAEWSNAGAGLHDDEPNVHYHFSSFGGVDVAGEYLRGDGDSRTDFSNGQPSAPIPTAWGDVLAAQPIAYIVLDAAAKAAGSGSSPTVGGVPQGWSDDGVTLVAPNGVPVVHGFRAYLLTAQSGWPDWDWPLVAEAARTPVEVGNPSLGGGTYQVFRTGQLTWTAARGVFETWTGQELLAVAAASATAQSQLAAVEAEIAQLQAAETKGAALITAMKTALG